MRSLTRTLCGLLIWAFLLSVQAAAQQTISAEFHGEWVAATAGCDATVRFRVTSTELTLVNGRDSQTWGGVGVPSGFFGPDYMGIIVVALPDFEDTQPFTVFFNADEMKGVTKLSIYFEMQGRLNPQLAAIQAAAKQLATRFPLNDIPLKKC